MPKTAQPDLEFHADVTLFDCYSLLFRAFHALPPMCTVRGEATNALYGFCSVVLKILREGRSAEFAFAIDAPQRTFRREQYEDYKGHRPAAPTPLREQIARLPALLEAFGAPVFCAPGFEADDVLATLAERIAATRSALIVSGDRDLFQLVREEVKVWFVGARAKDATLIDLAAIEARYGLPPARLPSYAALVGDSSDNLEGAPGVGPVTAAKLIREHGSVTALLANVDGVTPAKLRDSLRSAAERLLLNEKLSRLERDVPLPEGPLSGPLRPAALERLRGLFNELEFKSLLPRLAALPVSN